MDCSGNETLALSFRVSNIPTTGRAAMWVPASKSFHHKRRPSWCLIQSEAFFRFHRLSTNTISLAFPPQQGKELANSTATMLLESSRHHAVMLSLFASALQSQAHQGGSAVFAESSSRSRSTTCRFSEQRILQQYTPMSLLSCLYSRDVRNLLGIGDP